jgi:hypothetical protein
LQLLVRGATLTASLRLVLHPIQYPRNRRVNVNTP